LRGWSPRAKPHHAECSIIDIMKPNRKIHTLSAGIRKLNSLVN
jgi:hypothetical protein